MGCQHPKVEILTLFPQSTVLPLPALCNQSFGRKDLIIRLRRAEQPSGSGSREADSLTSARKAYGCCPGRPLPPLIHSRTQGLTQL